MSYFHLLSVLAKSIVIFVRFIVLLANPEACSMSYDTTFLICIYFATVVVRSLKVRYRKHPHIHVRTLFSGLRLILFLFEGCLVRNQPENVLKMFLKLVSEKLQIIYY